jgi:hypothetical protein
MSFSISVCLWQSPAPSTTNLNKKAKVPMTGRQSNLGVNLDVTVVDTDVVKVEVPLKL